MVKKKEKKTMTTITEETLTQKIEKIVNQPPTSRGSYLPHIRALRDLICTLETSNTDKFWKQLNAIKSGVYKLASMYHPDNTIAAKKMIKNWIKKDKGNFKEIFHNHFGDIMGQKIYEYINLEKEDYKELTHETCAKNFQKPVKVNVKKYLLKIEELLKSDNIFENIVGLIGATGRRANELLEDYNLKVWGVNTCVFSGQFKKKNEITKPFQIDTLVNSKYLVYCQEKILTNEKVVKIIDTIPDNLSNIEYRDALHARFTDRSNDIIKQHFDFLELYPGDTLSTRILRKITGSLLCEKLFDARNPQKLAYLSSFFGHDDSNSAKIFSPTTLNYMQYISDVPENIDFIYIPLPLVTVEETVEETVETVEETVETVEEINETMVIEKLKKEIETMKKEIESLKLENEVLKQKNQELTAPKIKDNITPKNINLSSKAPNTGAYKIKKAIAAIINFNRNYTYNNNEKVAITNKIVKEISHCSSVTLKRFWLQEKELLQCVTDYNYQKYNFPLHQNKGKNLDKIHQLITAKDTSIMADNLILEFSLEN
jgi:hypothetical protein